MLDALREAAKRVVDDHTLRTLLTDCQRLLSERGEANSASIARDLVSRFNRLPEDQRGLFFERLAIDFSPDPKAVLQSAQAYASNPNAANLVRLGQLAEPPRQELLRRINRLPGGTASIVAMRQWSQSVVEHFDAGDRRIIVTLEDLRIARLRFWGVLLPISRRCGKLRGRSKIDGDQRDGHSVV